MNPASEASTTEPVQEFLTFTLGNEEYAIDILRVQEIRGYDQVTSIANSPPFIKGVINLRGSVLPVIDLKQRLGLAETPYTENTRIVTVNIDDLHVGMLVDAVTEVLTIGSKPIDTKRAINDRSGSRFLSGIGNVDGRLIIMLNLEEIIGTTGDGK